VITLESFHGFSGALVQTQRSEVIDSLTQLAGGAAKR
jgi:hypothetical protein